MSVPSGHIFMKLQNEIFFEKLLKKIQVSLNGPYVKTFCIFIIVYSYIFAARVV